MRQLIHVVFGLAGSAAAIPAAAAAAAAAADHRLEVSGFLPGTHRYDTVHPETHKPPAACTASPNQNQLWRHHIRKQVQMWL